MKRSSKGRSRNDGTSIHPSLEGFAQTVADILVERHCERNRLRKKEVCEPSVKTPRHFNRTDSNSVIPRKKNLPRIRRHAK